MNNCLVTKLNGRINNDNLPLFDAIKVEFSFPNEKLGTSVSFNLNPLINVKAYLDGAVWDSNNDSTIIIPPYSRPNDYGNTFAFTPSSNDVTLIIGSKYNIASLRFIGSSGLGGYVSSLSLADLLFLQYFISIGCSGDTTNVLNADEFADKKGLAKLFDCGTYLAIDGNIASFAGFTDLETLDIGGNGVKEHHIVGELTELASGMVGNERTSGTLTFTSNKWVTLNGIALGRGTVKVITFDSSLPDGYSISDPV